MFDPSDITPKGVSLSDPADFKKRRLEIFETAKNSFAGKFPMSYGGFRLEVGDLRYEDPEHYTLKKQKEALIKDKYLSRRLRGTLHLFDEKDNNLLESKELTLMRVPYLTDRGTTIHNGNEYVTLTQARLLPGIYTRRKGTGEIESHFNARRGTGNAFRVRLEPESQLYKMDIGQASLRLYSLLHDIGVTDEQLKRSWGADILTANKAGYDARVFEKAYSKLVRRPDPEASRAEKVDAIKEALDNTKFSNRVLQRTLPNLFNRKIASTWFAKQAMMQPQQFQGVNPTVNPQLQGKPVANSPDAYVKYEEQKQKDAIKEQERKEKHRLSMDLLYGKLEEEGPDRDNVEKQMLQNQIALRKAKNQAMTKNITGQLKFESNEHIQKIKEETQRALDAVKRQKKELDDHKKDLEQRRKEDEDEQEKRKEDTRKENLKEDADLRKADAKEKAEERKAEAKEKVERRKADIKIKAEKRKAEIARKAERLKKELEASIKKYQPSKPKTEKKASDTKPVGDVKTVVDVLLEAKKHSDLKQYAEKTEKVRNLIKQNREDFFIDSDKDGIVGITHAPSNFRLHLPKESIFDLDVPVRNPKEAFYKESKKRNVKILPSGQMIDVDKLYASAKDRDIVKIPIEDLKGLGNRSRRNRFGPKRYEAADPTLPGLIDNSNYVVDGRHRVAKNKDNSGTTGLFYVVTPSDIRKAYIDGGHSDFKSETKIKF